MTYEITLSSYYISLFRTRLTTNKIIFNRTTALLKVFWESNTSCDESFCLLGSILDVLRNLSIHLIINILYIDRKIIIHRTSFFYVADIQWREKFRYPLSCHKYEERSVCFCDVLSLFEFQGYLLCKNYAASLKKWFSIKSIWQLVQLYFVFLFFRKTMFWSTSFSKLVS